ncbi:DUF2291 family protein [Paeniglutamicibacter sp. MACA_103]|uniref:DUF2291 family protein n=1 Tax=Paeniglutamicibacter sp. MACA_103 TaxID=3377337 RepID=UPI003895C109
MGTNKALRLNKPRAILTGGTVLLLVMMGVSTEVLTAEQTEEAASEKFSPKTYAESKFASSIAPAIIDRASDLAPMSLAISKDKDAAAIEFGVVSGSSAPVYSAVFAGVAGEVSSDGLLPVVVPGVSDDIKVLIQMGPAINGTVIRDATGLVNFPEFTNQIEYQNVGAELNNQVKEHVLSTITASDLNGKTVNVTGSFQPINPKAYIVTPVLFEVSK